MPDLGLAPPISPPSAPIPPPSEQSGGSTDPPPPTYAAHRPHILIAPLPDSPSFFWGRTVQGEVFVKGLGAVQGQSGVKSLYVIPSFVFFCLDDHN